MAASAAARHRCATWHLLLVTTVSLLLAAPRQVACEDAPAGAPPTARAYEECHADASAPVPPIVHNKTLTWTPRPDKFLVAICHTGKPVNQNSCLAQYFAYAALLNRTLVVPPRSFAKGAYVRADLTVDTKRVEQCFFNNTVALTLDEAKRALKTGTVTVEELYCWHGHMGPCWQPEWESYAKGFKLPKSAREGNLTQHMPLDRFVKEFGAIETPIISLGDLHGHKFASPEGDWLAAGFLPPLESNCSNYMQPSKAIDDTAVGYMDTMTGRHFAAVHLSKRGFWDVQRASFNHWNAKEVARFLAQELKDKNITVVYISTNANNSERMERQFDNALRAIGAEMVALTFRGLVRRAVGGDFYWARSWNDKSFDSDSHAVYLFQRLICTRAEFFFGTPGSPVSHEVYHLRRMEGTATCLDHDYI